jgi:hypothetical protein
MAKLMIANEATVTAEKGYSLTMTVNGVQTPIAPGIYSVHHKVKFCYRSKLEGMHLVAMGLENIF